jgi:L-histidine N-alpha-methyltransferase
MDSPTDTPVDQPLLRDAIEGLTAEVKTLPCKYLYDERGSELFDRICETEDYYPTRTEVSILERALPEISKAVGPGEVVIEPGAGSGQKTVMLIDALERPAAIVPIDISPDYVDASCEALQQKFPGVEVRGVVADFTEPMELPEVARDEDRRLVFFPGSTVGNFEPGERRKLLKGFADLAGHGGRLLLGFDLRKDEETLLRAYDDSEGVTAAFNLNILDRLNRELDAGFDVDSFRHEAKWNPDAHRVEMHLVSEKRQVVEIDEHRIEFDAGESIHTENSHKFDADGMLGELGSLGFSAEGTWFDEQRRFAVTLLRHAV